MDLRCCIILVLKFDQICILPERQGFSMVVGLPGHFARCVTQKPLDHINGNTLFSEIRHVGVPEGMQAVVVGKASFGHHLLELIGHIARMPGFAFIPGASAVVVRFEKILASFDLHRPQHIVQRVVDRNF